VAKLTTQERFELFHAANPHVYEMFVHFMKELLRRGHRRISPNFIVDRIRWEMMAPTIATPGSGWHVAAGKPFKINDHFASRYARLVIKRHPAAAKVIELREIRTP
jgi:hypothetical protein